MIVHPHTPGNRKTWNGLATRPQRLAKSLGKNNGCGCMGQFSTELGMSAEHPATQYLQAQMGTARSNLPATHCIAFAASMEKRMYVHEWDMHAESVRRMMQADQRELSALRVANAELAGTVRRLTEDQPDSKQLQQQAVTRISERPCTVTWCVLSPMPRESRRH